MAYFKRAEFWHRTGSVVRAKVADVPHEIVVSAADLSRINEKVERAVGFTIVCLDGVVVRSMMTYYVQFLLLVLAGWVNPRGIIKARRICCCSQPVTSYLSPSARCARVNGLAGCSVSTIGKPHEYFDLTAVSSGRWRRRTGARLGDRVLALFTVGDVYASI